MKNKTLMYLDSISIHHPETIHVTVEKYCTQLQCFGVSFAHLVCAIFADLLFSLNSSNSVKLVVNHC
jgi:hypothetical protein